MLHAFLMRLKFAGPVLAGLSVIASASASPPVNDEFTNRVVLTGASITFTATLAEATLGFLEPITDDCSGFGSPSGNVWFEWRGASSGPVYIIPESSTTNHFKDTLTVWAVTNDFYGQDVWGLPKAACMILGTSIYLPVWGFQVRPDLIQIIRVQGVSGGTFVFRMYPDPNPLLLEQPRNVTTIPGGTVLLTTSTFSISPLTYQWFHDGLPMSGDTTAMLMITNSQSADGGRYHVEIHNATGASTSTLAIVIITNQISAPVLSLGGPAGRFTLNIAADQGRSYRIESTTGTGTWTNEQILAGGEVAKHWSSVVWQTAPIFAFDFQAIGTHKFFRASSYHPANEICNGNLKRIRHAKQLWARDFNKVVFAFIPTWYDLTPYFKDGLVPQCPLGGTYPFTDMREWPRCSIAGHVVEEPR